MIVYGAYMTTTPEEPTVDVPVELPAHEETTVEVPVREDAPPA